MQTKWVLEDFDHDLGCWVIVAIADNEDQLETDEGYSYVGSNYNSQFTTRTREVAWIS